jgi:hypothetical protein
MTSEFTTPVSFPDFDKLRYLASFTEEGRVLVKRLQGRGVLRGRWEFEFSDRATWVCVKCRDPWVKNTDDNSYSPQFVPEPVALKVKAFLSSKLQVDPGE